MLAKYFCAKIYKIRLNSIFRILYLPKTPAAPSNGLYRRPSSTTCFDSNRSSGPEFRPGRGLDTNTVLSILEPGFYLIPSILRKI